MKQERLNAMKKTNTTTTKDNKEEDSNTGSNSSSNNGSSSSNSTRSVSTISVHKYSIMVQQKVSANQMWRKRLDDDVVGK